MVIGSEITPTEYGKLSDSIFANVLSWEWLLRNLIVAMKVIPKGRVTGRVTEQMESNHTLSIILRIINAAIQAYVAFGM